MNKSRALLTSEKGQGLVEYILLLVVVVTIALTFMNLFFKPYAKWASQHIGSYVECLLDQGELPGLGGANGIKDCDLESAGFGGGGSKTAGGGKTSTDDVSKDTKDSDSGSKDQITSNGTGSTVLGTARDGSSRMRRLGGMDGGGTNSKTFNVGSEGGGSGSGNMRINARYPQIITNKNKRDGGAFLSGMLEAEKEKIKKREAKNRKLASTEVGGVTNQAKKFNVEMKQKKARDVAFSEEGWSFGKLFRLLLIIVIIIALVLFIGGQVMQITKGMEK